VRGAAGSAFDFVDDEFGRAWSDGVYKRFVVVDAMLE
jgi:hypothetical protein